MNTYREMVLVSVDEFNRIRKQLLFQQPAGEKPTLHKELYDIKDKVEYLPDDQRIKLEGEVIAKHTDHMRPTEEDETIALKQKPADTQFLSQHLDLFPNVNKKRAQQMLYHLSSFKQQWNERGQLIDDSGEPIPRSNVIELIDHVTNTRRTSRIPAGFSSFVKLLDDSNIPRHLLSTQGLHKVDNYKHSESDFTEDPIIPKWIKL